MLTYILSIAAIVMSVTATIINIRTLRRLSSNRRRLEALQRDMPPPGGIIEMPVIQLNQKLSEEQLEQIRRDFEAAARRGRMW